MPSASIVRQYSNEESAPNPGAKYNILRLLRANKFILVANWQSLLEISRRWVNAIGLSVIQDLVREMGNREMGSRLCCNSRIRRCGLDHFPSRFNWKSKAHKSHLQLMMLDTY